MHVDIKPAIKIDTDLLEQQRELIGNLVANLESGRTGIAIRRDLDALIGIQGTLDAIGDAAERAASVDHDDIADLAKRLVEEWDIETCMESAETALYEFWISPIGADDYECCKEEHVGPECPGCTHPSNCKDCEY